MKKIEEFLKLKEVIEGIESNIKPYQKENSIIENQLHYSKEKSIYLVEIRIFNDGQMTNAYLDVFNSDMSHLNEYLDDVWSFIDWVIV